MTTSNSSVPTDGVMLDTNTARALGQSLASTGYAMLIDSPLFRINWSFYRSHITTLGGPNAGLADMLSSGGIRFNPVPMDYTFRDPVPVDLTPGQVNGFLGFQAEVADLAAIRSQLGTSIDYSTPFRSMTTMVTPLAKRIYDSKVLTSDFWNGATQIMTEVKSGAATNYGRVGNQAAADLAQVSEINIARAGARGVGIALRSLGAGLGGASGVLDVGMTSLQFAQDIAAGDYNAAEWTGASFAGRWSATLWGAAAGSLFFGPFGAILGGLMAQQAAQAGLEALRGSDPDFLNKVMDQMFDAGLVSSSVADVFNLGASSSGSLRRSSWMRGLNPLKRRDPLVFDLAGSGLNLTQIGATAAHFDYDGDGYAVQTGWIGGGQGLLVQIPADGQTITADQLIGARSGHALADLAAMDANHDGVIDARDPAYARLALWVDANGDGVSAAGEIIGLAAAGIVSISLSSQAVGQDLAGNHIISSAAFTRADGTGGSYAEVDFTVDTALTRFMPATQIQAPDFLKLLPNLDGYGRAPDLLYAMAMSPALADEVKGLVLQAGVLSADAFQASFEHMMQTWAGLAAPSANPTVAGQMGPVDPAHLAVVEAYLGVTWAEHNGWVAITAASAKLIEDTYRIIVDHQMTRFVTQVSTSQMYLGMGLDRLATNPFIDYSLASFDSEADSLDVNFSTLAESVIADMAGAQDPLSYAEKTGRVLASFKTDLFGGDIGAEVAAIRAVASPIAGGGRGYAEFLLSQFANVVPAAASAGQRTGTTAADAIYAGAGNNVLSGGQGDDFYIYRSGDGNDTIEDHWQAYQPMQTNRLLMPDLLASDVQLTRRGDDLLVKNLRTGATLQVSGHFGAFDGVAQIVFADGAIWDRGRILAAAWMRGGDASETIVGSGDADTIAGGLGADTLRGGAGDDVYVYRSGDGNDRIEEAWQPYQTAQNNRLLLQDLLPGDVQLARLGNDLFVRDLKTGQVITVAGHFNRWAGMTSIVFADGSSWDSGLILASAAFRGTSGVDTLSGSSGADTIIGGQGDDVLFGGQGDDVYVYRTGDGNDTIEEHWQPYWSAEANRLVLSDLNASDVQLSRAGADLLIKDLRTGQTIKVTGHFNGFDGLASIGFADGSSMDRTQIQAAAWIRGTAGADVLAGSTLNDTIVGGAGNDTLSGGQGNDVYIYRSGDGNDVIEEHWQAYWAQEANRLVLSDLTASDVQLVHSGSDLIIKDLKTGQSIRVTGHFNSFDGLASIAFANGATMDRSAILAAAVTQGTSGADMLTFGGSGTLDMGAGDDSVKFSTGNNAGLAGDVTVLFRKGDGHDTYWANMSGDLKSATLKLLDINRADVSFAFNPAFLHNTAIPNDITLTVTATGDSVNMGCENIAGYPAFEKVVFADGTSMTRAEIIAAAVYKGTAGADSKSFGGAGTLDMGKGDDVVKFDTGNNAVMAGDVTVVFRKGDGHDTYWANMAGDLKSATLKLLDINKADVTFTFNPAFLHNTAIPNDITLTVTATGDSVNMGCENIAGYPAFEKVIFADGTTMTRADIIAASVYKGTAGADSKSFGGAGTLDMGKGDDVVKFDTGGNASLAGAVTVLFRKGDGHDTYWSNTANDLKSATLKLLDINRSEVIFNMNPAYRHDGTLVNDIIMVVAATGDSVNMGLENWAGMPAFTSIVFADGTTMSQAEIQAAAWFRGGDGADVLSGSSVADTLFGGKGNDTLTGLAGADTFVFGPQSGHDVVTDFKTADRDALVFDRTLFASTSAVIAASSQVGADVRIAMSATDDVLLKGVQLSSLAGADIRLM